MGLLEAIGERIYAERPNDNFVDLNLLTGNSDLPSNFYFNLILYFMTQKSKLNKMVYTNRFYSFPGPTLALLLHG